MLCGSGAAPLKDDFNGVYRPWYDGLLLRRPPRKRKIVVLVIATIGYLAAILTTLSALPQLLRILCTRDARGISIQSYVTLSAGVALWLVYGASVGSGPLMFANAISLALDLGIVYCALRARPQHA
jgi:MtN3 and saliva related transmembrane protein